MKNPYLYGYLPLFTIILFSFTFGIFGVSESLQLFQSIGVYNGMREFLSDLELRFVLLIVFALLFFMVFSALKLIGETIHELGMLFFSKDKEGQTIHAARGGYVIFFFGAFASVIGTQSWILLIAIFLTTTFCYFIYYVYKMSQYMSFVGVIGLIFFEVLSWCLLLALIVYAIVKLYNGILASFPFV
ncbi:YufK family protein [Solibacillus daqui]|uniref:YufK family protein n=1 Tax=Solibacillus daqui TaxID=2912187 RepID=UPI002366BF63|nr:YufK family protein [Solibacillus daqui]